MADLDRRDGVVEKETVIVERGGGGGIIAAIALLIAVVAVLAYFGMLPDLSSDKRSSLRGAKRRSNPVAWSLSGLLRCARNDEGLMLR
jgi:hypothetical protein